MLVTSKGEPATEVLREKLPPGVRALCVALGGAGDASALRRLEARRRQRVVGRLRDVARTTLADALDLGCHTGHLRRALEDDAGVDGACAAGISRLSQTDRSPALVAACAAAAPLGYALASHVDADMRSLGADVAALDGARYKHKEL